MAIAVTITLTAASQAAIARAGQAAPRVEEALGRGLGRILEDLHQHIVDAMFTGNQGAGGGQLPVGTRTGQLRQAMMFQQDQRLSGFLGVRQGATDRYAAAILGDQTVTIRPRTAGHLWVPVGENLDPSGVPRLSPSALFDQYDRRKIAIFRSPRSGKLIAGVDAHVPGSRRKGFKVLFVLKDQVTVIGAGLFMRAVTERLDQVRDILQEELEGALG
jgi:predicted acyl esterase